MLLALLCVVPVVGYAEEPVEADRTIEACASTCAASGYGVRSVERWSSDTSVGWLCHCARDTDATCGDTNGDGVVGFDDVQRVIATVLGLSTGDLQCHGEGK